MKEEIKLEKRKPTWNYILNDIALYGLLIKVTFSESATSQEKFDLMYQVKLLQSQLKAKEEENEQLKADYGNLAQVERDFLKEIIKEAREYIKEHIRIDDEYPAYMEMLITERDELDEILSKGENK